MKTENQYDQQAADFLAKYGVKFRATLSDSKPAPWEDGNAYRPHYRVTLSKPGARLAFDFWDSVNAGKELARAKTLAQSIATAELIACDGYGQQKANARAHLADLAERRESLKTGLTPYSALACISSDVHCPETFADFCAEYGYEEDSRKAMQTFRRADRFAKRLRAFFTEDELNALAEIQ